MCFSSINSSSPIPFDARQSIGPLPSCWIMPQLWRTQVEIQDYSYIHQSKIWKLIHQLESTSFSCKMFVLTPSTLGSGWTGWGQGFCCHIVCQGEGKQLNCHLWSLGNHNMPLCPWCGRSAQWKCPWVVRWCRHSLTWMGSCLGMKARSASHWELWNCLHMHHGYSSIWFGSHQWIHIQSEIRVHCWSN